jgi:hypothetical protein
VKISIVLGSMRKSLPPKPSRLGARVSEALRAHLEADYPDDDIELIDRRFHPRPQAAQRSRLKLLLSRRWTPASAGSSG